MTAALIRPLVEADVAAFRALRLEALRLEPEAFGSSLEEEQARDEAAFRARLPTDGRSALFGAFIEGRLVGTMGLRVMAGAKERHKAEIWGVYVTKAARGQGLAKRLLDQTIAQARAVPGLERLLLGVGATNAPARALYQAAGFELYGVERRALRLGADHYIDEELRVLALG